MSAFKNLLPNDVVIVEAQYAWMWESGLLPEEAQYVKTASAKRQREFTAGRNCARAALAILRAPVVAIAVGKHREPVFPIGYSGSITHTLDYCAAAVSPINTHRQSIGIDAEDAGSLDTGARQLVLRTEELRMIDSQNDANGFSDKLIFSIKEAFFKAYFQRTKGYLDFLDACVQLHPDQNSFSIRVLRSDVGVFFENRSFEGRYCYEGKRILTAIALCD